MANETSPIQRRLSSASRTTRLLALLIALTLGAAVGITGYTFVYAKGASYLSNDPRACANCHIMQDHLDGWIEAENSSGFHAPQEALRILGESINFARKGQLALRPLQAEEKAGSGP
jgi:nitrate/TMAO reductase-like tetraheme cytochrome c subunit